MAERDPTLLEAAACRVYVPLDGALSLLCQNCGELEENHRPRECTVCKSGAGLLVACAHFDGQAVCLWDYGDDEPVVCGPSPEPHYADTACGDNHMVFGSMAEAQAEFPKRAELLRLGAADVA